MIKEFAGVLGSLHQQPMHITRERLEAMGPLVGDFIKGAEVSQSQIEAAFGVYGNTVIAAAHMIPVGEGKVVAVVPVKGICLYEFDFPGYAVGMRQLASTVKTLAADENVSTILLDINSPGGTVTGVPEAADAIYAARQSGKTVHALINPMCASAAYYLASQASTITMTPSGDVGSIGTFIMHMDVSGMMDQIGWKPTFIVAETSPNKVKGNSFEPLSDDAKSMFQQIVDEANAEFLSTVARGRGLSVETVQQTFGQGDLLKAGEALQVGMIDGIGAVDATMLKLGIANTDAGQRARFEEPGEEIQAEDLAEAPENSDEDRLREQQVRRRRLAFLKM